MGDEPEFAENDLEERIKTTKNRCEIALLLIELDRMDLVYTIIEDMALGCQIITDEYCIKKIIELKGGDAIA